MSVTRRRRRHLIQRESSRARRLEAWQRSIGPRPRGSGRAKTDVSANLLCGIAAAQSRLPSLVKTSADSRPPRF
jgi:hypothetical protein